MAREVGDEPEGRVERGQVSRGDVEGLLWKEGHSCKVHMVNLSWDNQETKP